MDAASTSPTASPAMARPDLAKMRDTARRFESQALGSLLQHAFATVQSAKGGFGGGPAEEQWRPMMVTAYAEAWTRRGGIGMADAVLREMVRLQGAPAPVNQSATNAAGE